jgi:hypothetical protein
MRYVTDTVAVKWCLDNSISSQVTTPVSAADLASALISALESSTVSPVAATNDVTFDILLAEDNLVNQKLAVKILEKYGHVVEIAENGSLAVEAFKARVQKNRPFDLILVSALRIPNCGGANPNPDGCFHAIHGRHGSHRTHSGLRDATWVGPHSHHCIDRPCQYVASRGTDASGLT